MSRASLNKIPQEISDMFDGVAARYDRANSVFTLGMDVRWRKKMVQALRVSSGDIVLDLAAGTGVSTRAIRDQTGALAIGVDFSLGMLHARRDSSIPLIKADVLALPIKDTTCDAVCIAFGLRNVHDPCAAIQEALRVLKPGGRFVILETSVPSRGLARLCISSFGYRFAKFMGAMAGSNAPAYKYLIESVSQWPDASILTQIISRMGFVEIQVQKLLFGSVAIHSAVKPGKSVKDDTNIQVVQE